MSRPWPFAWTAPTRSTSPASAARRRGYEHLGLYSNEKMTENLKLYHWLGYEETHRVEEKGFHRVYMRKRLAGRPGG